MLRFTVEARTPSRVELLAFCALSTTQGNSLARGESSETETENERGGVSERGRGERGRRERENTTGSRLAHVKVARRKSR